MKTSSEISKLAKSITDEYEDSRERKILRRKTQYPPEDRTKNLSYQFTINGKEASVIIKNSDGDFVGAVIATWNGKAKPKDEGWFNPDTTNWMPSFDEDWRWPSSKIFIDDPDPIHKECRYNFQKIVNKVKKELTLFAVDKSKIEKGYRGRGLGVPMYELLIIELGKRGIALTPDEAAYGGSTSLDAKRVWNSLKKKHSGKWYVEGDIVYAGN